MITKTKQPRCIVIARPNGAGKTTFAREYLPKDARVIHFVNADLIAGGLSPLRPELAALTAGRLVLAELDRLAKSKQSFAFETTLSGQTYLSRLKRWKAAGYRIEILFLRLSSAQIALRRIAARVRQGGTTFRPKMLSAASSEDGRTLLSAIGLWPTVGQSMKTPDLTRS